VNDEMKESGQSQKGLNKRRLPARKFMATVF
jgi:hypothetical protein